MDDGHKRVIGRVLVSVFKVEGDMTSRMNCEIFIKSLVGDENGSKEDVLNRKVSINQGNFVSLVKLKQGRKLEGVNLIKLTVSEGVVIVI